MKLIVQPRDGLTPLLTGIRQAKKEVDIVIFRCDRPDIQHALEAAVQRGVKVRALIAHTNRGGEKNLRKLELQLLDAGATVARTGDEFVRYHGKIAIIDRATLFVLGFNFTGLDVNRSRSFGIVTRRKAEVAQALRLFEADATRQPFEPGNGDTHLIVSPENARQLLSEFIRKAKKQLLIYDPKVSDTAIGKLLKERHKAGVDVRIIGKVAGAADSVPHEKYPGKRLHVRAIIRDGRDAFVGSQSLRKLELDERREVGIIVKGSQVVSEMTKTFEDDWALTASGKRKDKEEKDETPKEKRATA
jgi:phosphatidylserine/phosphatidylglycerophosphate/cardiolipin synthase-like enzyme